MAKYKIIPSSRTIMQSPISIGHKAEKGVEAIEFDLTAWVETYGSGTLTVIMRRWGDAIPYPIALEIDENNKATWTLSDIDTAKAGMAYAQLNYIVGETVVKKSDIYTFRVMDSLTGEGEPPEAYESWLENLTHFAAEAMAEVLDIEGIVTDKTLSVDGGIADGKATGDALALKADKSTTYTKTEVDHMIEDVEVETDTTLAIPGAPADAKKVGDKLSALKADLDDVDIRLSSLDGLRKIALEPGDIGYGWSSLTFSDSLTRMRTPENGGVPVSAGDKIIMESWEGNAFYPIIYESDGHYHNFNGWHDADFTIPVDGVLYFVIRKNPERNLTSEDVFNICLKEPDKIQALEQDVTRITTDISSIDSQLKALSYDDKGMYPVLVSHGGLEGLYPENTILGVHGAKKYGYDITEADMRITSDGHFVICHDETVDRTTDGSGTIANMTLEQVKACNIDKWGPFTYNTWTWNDLKIPTLEEYLETCIKCDIIPMIEARDFTESQLDDLIAIIRDYNLEDIVIIESFYKATLTYLRSISRVKLGALLDASTDNVDYCEALGNCLISINATTDNPSASFMQYARNKNVPVSVWTVNDVDRINALAGLGVLHVITDWAVNKNSFDDAYCAFYKAINDINSDTPDSWGFRYYVGDMISSWSIPCTALKSVVSFKAEIYYDTNKPTLIVAGNTIALDDKPNDWQTVSLDTIIGINSNLTNKAQISLKLAETGNVKMKNASVIFRNIM